MGKKLEKYLLDLVSGRKKGILAFIVSIILFFLEYIYRLVLKIRRILYKIGIIRSKRLDSKVISIGNITVGGTGKTPLVRLIADSYKKNKQNVVIISRGYKSKESQPQIVFDGKELLLTPEESSDEALMLSSVLNEIPIATGKDRYKVGELVLKEFAPDIILLDDGFQHWQLARDKDIVLIDATNPFGYNHLIPRGLLREPLQALSRADIFLITKVNCVSKERIDNIVSILNKYNKTAGIFMGKYENKYIRLYKKSGDKEILDVNFLEGKNILAFSGIGNPSSFQKSLEDSGTNVLFHHVFPDHYQYTGKDIEVIVKKANKTKAYKSSNKNIDMIITTAKDLVRLSKEMRGLLIAEYNLAVLEIDMKVDKEEDFIAYSLRTRR